MILPRSGDEQRSSSRYDSDGAVIVAVVTVLVVQPTLDNVADVVAMRNRLVPTTRAVDVPGLVPAAARAAAGAAAGVGRVHFEGVFFHFAIAAHVV
jgi:hypothetical protein